MAQILDPLPTNDDNNHIICCYVNATSQIQIARITNIPNWYFERVVFPGQRLVFEALPEGLLEIHTGMMASAIISDTISCKALHIKDNSDEHQEQMFIPVAVKTDEKPKISSSEKKSNKNSIDLVPLALSC